MAQRVDFVFARSRSSPTMTLASGFAVAVTSGALALSAAFHFGFQRPGSAMGDIGDILKG